MSGSYYVYPVEEEDKSDSSNFKCQVHMLDGSREDYTIFKKAVGQNLMDLVFDTLELIERDYFGLQFKDSHPVSGVYNRWLNGAKPMKKQLQGSQPFQLYLRIRFYPPDITKIKKEYTKYLLYLQLKKDLFEDRIHCSKDIAAILASYVIQAELGDYNPQFQKSGFLSDYKFVKYQTPEFETEVVNLYATRKNMSATKAENEFLAIASNINHYGVDLFNALTIEKEIVQIGPSALGFNVFQNKKRIHLFHWNFIFKISFKKKRLCVLIKNSNNPPTLSSPVHQQSTQSLVSNSQIRYTYVLSSFPICKTLWQNCVDYHVFFRLNNCVNNQGDSKSSVVPSSSSICTKLNTQRNNCHNNDSNVQVSVSRTGNIFGYSGSMTPGILTTRRSTPFLEDLDKRSHSNNFRFVRDFNTKNIAKTSSSTSVDHKESRYIGNEKGVISKPQSDNHSECQCRHCIKYKDPNSFNSKIQSKSHSSLSSSNVTNNCISTHKIFAKFDTDSCGSSCDEDDECTKKSRVAINSCLKTTNQDQGKNKGEKSKGDSRSNIYRSSISATLSRKASEGKSSYKPLDRFHAMNKSLDESINPTLLNETRLSNSSMESLPEIKITRDQYYSESNARMKVPTTQKQTSNNSSISSSRNNNGGINGFCTTRKPTTRYRCNSLGVSLTTTVITLYPDHTGRYGFTIRDGAINNIAPLSSADTCYPRLHVGDQIVAIGDIELTEATEKEATELVKKCASTKTGELRLTIQPCNYLVDYMSQEPADSNVDSIRDRYMRKFQVRNKGRYLGTDNSIRSTKSHLELTNGSTDPVFQSMRMLEIALDSDELLRQFETVYRAKPGLTMNQAKKTENFIKNRYRDISPYDQTRVVLRSYGTDCKYSDYINASIINMRIGDRGPTNRYIAAQGPLAHTVADFWQMCWEQGTRLIVMVTALTEGGRAKCHRYWPVLYETEEIISGISDAFQGDSGQEDGLLLQVSCLGEERSTPNKTELSAVDDIRVTGWTERELVLYSPRTGEERRIRQLQYDGWPDHGVPPQNAEFVRFVNRVRKCRASHPLDPVIVHCSAGIGRTGVLITMETAMCLLESGLSVDPLELLRTMREQRPSMIQTSAQFLFVCEAILKVYKEFIHL